MLDVAIGQKAKRRCDGTSRRDFLRVGGLGALGLSLSGVLQAEAAAAEGARASRAKSISLVYLGGGLSHHDSFDMKPEAPAEVRGKYKPIASNVPGLMVGELMPKMAQVMNKLTLIRSGA